MPRYPDGWEKADKISGWFSLNEARLISSLCRGTWCEIGCHHGRSTVILAESGYEGYAIDTWLGSPEMARVDSFPEFYANLGGYENVTIIEQDFRDAVEMTPSELQLLHLDADHSYEMTKLAYELYAPKLLPEGYLCLHDARQGAWPGVERFLRELLKREWEQVGLAKTLVALQRR